MSDEKRQNKVPIRALALGILAATAFIIAFWQAPWWFDSLHIRKTNLQPADGVIITGVRTGLVAFAAGIIAGAGLWYTHKKHELEQQQFLHVQEQFRESQKQFETTLRETQKRDERQAELTREGQVTGRYVEAIKLLASENPAERLGGIYALERIMADSHRDLSSIIDVLAAFIRTQSSEARNHVEVHAAFKVIGRRPDGPTQTILFTGANLSHSYLESPKFPHVSFDSATLREVNWKGALLSNAHFSGADLSYAVMPDGNLNAAVMIETKMQNANFQWASFVGTDLRAACMEGANLSEANLEDAILGGADLDDADLEHASGLTPEAVGSALVYRSTKLPSDIAANYHVRQRIAECERERNAASN
jgi:uncharacterized protein YjbI with pentapeptide repeats